MPEHPVTFSAGNLRLEGMYLRARSPKPQPAVICHPHPAYGGTMDNNVVMAAAGALQETGHSTLRFNFRGVGGSEGQYGGGTGEIEDVQAAIGFVLDEEGDVPVVLVGYSFGAWVTAKMLEGDDSVAHVILIAPPTAMFDLSPLLNDGRERSRHIIVGERDQFCDRESLQQIYDRLPEPKSMRVIPRADHFFFMHEDSLIEAIKEAVADHSPL
ncbi:MAG: alpha/beta fold hydrolase [Candidatus Abyssobacteria bacterium SURF_5]|uniref:Alpha/beta fold hydrolase n=1 Tax=Abyssobacteria bacterium (strain SURF_5) TaxID=2093360 RepID=A0A3A4NV55_ABYX5|nr:MAG: alpha/beta fold hydrolase [Candidatus Abyssubacteria bacterium SURF_5]